MQSYFNEVLAKTEYFIVYYNGETNKGLVKIVIKCNGYNALQTKVSII